MDDTETSHTPRGCRVGNRSATQETAQIIPLRAQRAADASRFRHLTDDALLACIDALVDEVRSRPLVVRAHVLNSAHELALELMPADALEGLCCAMEPREYIVTGQPEGAADADPGSPARRDDDRVPGCTFSK